LGQGQEIACATPLTLLSLPPASHHELASGVCVRIAGYYHDSLIDGPGRRSTAKLQGCPIRCRGCVTPDSWDPAAGTVVPVNRLAQALLDPAFDRDGITIAGGEPFRQPQGLWALIQELRARGCRHLLVYSGYTYERLQRMAAHRPAIGDVLGEVDVLVDGPYVQALADGAGRWVGSRNQRVIDLPATRRTGHVVLLGECSPNRCAAPAAGQFG
jgi:anaerobic ribonucleoside-triphosphate reductase activating protein